MLFILPSLQNSNRESTKVDSTKILWKPFPQYYCSCPWNCLTFQFEVYSAREGRAFLWNSEKIVRKYHKQATKICCGHAMLRMQFQASHSDPPKTIAKQNSTISKQAKLLPAHKRTLLNSTLLKKFPLLVQNHLEPIPVFLLPGKNVWW